MVGIRLSLTPDTVGYSQLRYGVELLLHRVCSSCAAGLAKSVGRLPDFVGPQAKNPEAGAQVMYMSLKQLRPSVPAEMPEDYRELMDRCWAFLPGVRPSFQVLGPYSLFPNPDPMRPVRAGPHFLRGEQVPLAVQLGTYGLADSSGLHTSDPLWQAHC